MNAPRAVLRVVVPIALLVGPLVGRAEAAIDSAFSPEWQSIGRLITFALLIGVLIVFLRKPIAGFFADRTAGIQAQLAEATRERDEALARLAEVEARMRGLDQELDDFRRQAEAGAAAEAELITRRTEEEAARLRHNVRQEIEGLTRQAVAELRRVSADRATELAEELVRREIGPADEDRMFAGFLEQVGGRS